MIEEAEDKHAECIRKANSIFLQSVNSYDPDLEVDYDDPMAPEGESGEGSQESQRNTKDRLSTVNLSASTAVEGDLDMISEALEEEMVARIPSAHAPLGETPVDSVV